MKITWESFWRYFLYVAVVILLLSNVKWWGKKEPFLNGIWSDIAIGTILICVVEQIILAYKKKVKQ